MFAVNIDGGIYVIIYDEFGNIVYDKKLTILGWYPKGNIFIKFFQLIVQICHKYL